MLAQNFKTAADLSISDVELDALIKVLGMLERGEIPFATCPENLSGFRPHGEGFNMGPYLKEGECGTVACIAGWAHVVSGRRAFEWVETLCPPNTVTDDLHELFHVDSITYRKRLTIKPPQAARALRSYLATGKPNWAQALAS